MWGFNTNLPSGRIRFGIKALEEFEEEPNCTVIMTMYHLAEGDKCFACLGGAAGLYHFQIPRAAWPTVDGWQQMGCVLAQKGDIASEELAQRIYDVQYFEISLEYARTGEVGQMFRVMGLDIEEGEKYEREITHYHNDPQQFRMDLAQLANELEEAGY